MPRTSRTARAAALAAFSLLAACRQWDEITTIDTSALHPPVLRSIAMMDSTTVAAVFDKAARAIESECLVSPGGGLAGVTAEGTTLLFRLNAPVDPGSPYLLEAAVRDERGNSMNFIHRFWGYNPRVPRLLINEFITTPSSTVPTQVEIVVLSPGNMAGVALFEGTKNDPDKEFVFPPLSVATGDFILVHFKPEGTPGEVNESTSKAEASGKGASPEAWDFWAVGTGNLSVDNDTLTLYRSPDGDLIDCVVYSSKAFKEGDRYNGFGTASMFARVKELAAGGWQCDFDPPRPTDAFNPRGATSRRSICRSSTSRDTDDKTDWHIVPSGRATFGRPNSDEVYRP